MGFSDLVKQARDNGFTHVCLSPPQCGPGHVTREPCIKYFRGAESVDEDVLSPERYRALVEEIATPDMPLTEETWKGEVLCVSTEGVVERLRCSCLPDPYANSTGLLAQNFMVRLTKSVNPEGECEAENGGSSSVRAEGESPLNDTDRLYWLVRRIPGSLSRPLLGELGDTGSLQEWRRAIDAAVVNVRKTA